MCSSPLQSPGRLRILFNIIEQRAANGRHCDRRGVCTGWLSDVTLPMLSQSCSMESTVEKLSFTDKPILVSYSVIRFHCMMPSKSGIWCHNGVHQHVCLEHWCFVKRCTVVTELKDCLRSQTVMYAKQVVMSGKECMIRFTVSMVVLNCCKGDKPSQWETPIFRPL